MASYKLLSVTADAKTSKGAKLGYLTGILYLAPSTIAGVGNLCPMADVAGCREACLYSAGRGAFSNVQAARIRKTRRFAEDRGAFMADIVRDIERLKVDAARQGLIPLVRLNGTSDIRWESIEVDGHPSIMDRFPTVQFYDYTKIPNRRDVPKNYDLTFSYSGRPEYQPAVEKAIAHGMRLAVVFSHRALIPDEFLGLRVVDGDDTDVRHLDPGGVVVALYAKGAARSDTRGFVVSLSPPRRSIPIRPL